MPWTPAISEKAPDEETGREGGVVRRKAFEKREEEERTTAALPHVPPDAFARLSAAGEATPEQARSCIYNLKHEMQGLPLLLSLRREASAAHHIGGRVLHWLWSQPMSIRDDLSMNRVFVDSLCYFLVAEGREDFVFKWLKLELANEKRHVRVSQRHLWLPGLMVAQREWTDSVVPSLTSLQRALVDFRGKHFPDLTLAANVAAMRMFMSHTIPPYPPELFDAFLSVNLASGPRHINIWREAEARLFHPTSPDAKPILHLLRGPTVTV